VDTVADVVEWLKYKVFDLSVQIEKEQFAERDTKELRIRQEVFAEVLTKLEELK
jgi:hypothetical protein